MAGLGVAIGLVITLGAAFAILYGGKPDWVPAGQRRAPGRAILDAARHYGWFRLARLAFMGALGLVLFVGSLTRL